MKAEPCTNWYHTRRHLSDDMQDYAGNRGRYGSSLCSNACNFVTVWDEDGINACTAEYRRGKPRIELAQIPECKNCARIVAKRGGPS